MAILLSSGIYGFISSLKKTAGEYTENFLSGFSGHGWKIWEHATGRYKLEIDDITVRGGMTIYELLIEKIRSIKGAFSITQTSGKVKEVSDDATNYYLTIEEEMGFVANDIIRCQSFGANSLKSYWVIISAITDNKIVIPKTEFEEGMSAPSIGDDIIQFGNTTDKARQSAIYLHTNGGVPAIDVMFGINSKSFEGRVKLRLGSGIEGENESYTGLFCENGLIKSVDSNGVEMYKFRPDGSGHLAKNAISWDTAGKLSFGPGVSLNWTSAIDTAKEEAITSATTTAATDAAEKAEAAKNAAIQAAATDASSKAGEAAAAAVTAANNNTSNVVNGAVDALSTAIAKAETDAVDSANLAATEALAAAVKTINTSVAEAKSAGTTAQNIANAINEKAATEKWSTKLTYIDGTGIFTGKLSAVTVEAISISATQITSGTIDAKHINVDQIKTNILTAANINALELTTIKGTIGGWTIAAGKISSGCISLSTASKRIAVFKSTASDSSGDRVQMFYNSDSDFGIYAELAGVEVFKLGAQNKIAGWSFDSNSFFSGTKNNAAAEFTSTSGAITIGSNGIRGFKWRFDSDGAGAVASGNISWNAAGAVTFGSNVAKSWTEPIGALSYLKDALKNTAEISGGLLLSSVIGAKDATGSVKSYMSGTGVTAFAAGVANFGTASETKKINLKHDGTGNIGIFQIDSDGKVKIFDTTDSTLVRILFSDIDLPTIQTMLSSSLFSGSASNSGNQATNGTVALPNTINVTQLGSTVKFTGSAVIDLYSLDGTSGVGKMIIRAELHRDGAYWGLLDTWTVTVDNTKTWNYLYPTIDQTRTVAAGVYQVKFVVTTSGNADTSISTCIIGNSTLSWAFNKDIRRFEFGKNGFMGYYTNNHIYYTETGGLDVRGSSNIPGVLATATCSALGGISNQWGAKVGSTSNKMSTGYYRVYHTIGHIVYTATANGLVENTIVSVYGKSGTYVDFVVTKNGARVDSGFEYSIFGKNY